MESVALYQVAEAVKGTLVNGKAEGHINGVSTDSRTIKKGQLFIPIKGDRFDGHDFISDAVSRGAAAVFSARNMNSVFNDVPVIKVKDTLYAMHELAYWYRRQFNVSVIGVTGSTGKTTVKDFIAAVLTEKYRVLKTEGNFNNEIGMPLTMFELEKVHEAAVLEMGMSSFGEIRKMTGIARPEFGVITNIGVSHIEKLGSKENILKAKLELFTDFDESCTAVLNGDDPLLIDLKDKYVFRKIYFGIQNNPDMFNDDYAFAFDIRLSGEEGSVFSVDYKGLLMKDIYIPALGLHNIYNSLPAIVLGIELGVEKDGIRKALEGYKPEKMRINILNCVNNLKVIDDTYNASPDSMKAAADVLMDIAKGRAIAVLGDMLEMGDYAEEGHMQTGKYMAARGVDYLIAVGENGLHTLKGAMEAGMDKQKIRTYNCNEDVIKGLYTIVKPGDTILVKGSRGMKMEQIVEWLREECL